MTIRDAKVAKSVLRNLFALDAEISGTAVAIVK